MTLPLPAVAPDTSVWDTVHVNVVPAILLVSEMDVVLPEQNSWDMGVAVVTGFGLTVTMIVTGIPGHPFANGVIV